MAEELECKKYSIISNYYNNLALICLNKLYIIEKEDIIKELTKIDINKIIVLLFNESNMQQANEYKYNLGKIKLASFKNIDFQRNFESGNFIGSFETSFNKENIIDEDNKDDLNESFIYEKIKLIEYIKHNNVTYYDNDICQLNLEMNKNNYLFVLSDEVLNSKSFGVDNIQFKKKDEKYLKIIEKENQFKNKFIKNYSNIILNIIKDEIKNEALNEKGKYFLLQIIIRVIEYINKEDIYLISKYLWKLYEQNKEGEDKYSFKSFKFIDSILNKYYNNNKNCNEKIFNKNENNNSIYDLFNYKIKNNSFGIYSKITKNIFWNKDSLSIPIVDTNKENIKLIYENKIKALNISFYKCHDIYTNQLINDDSFLFTKIINDSNDFSDLSNLIENNNNKIKAIILSEINDNMEKSYFVNLINKYKKPIYLIKKNIYKSLIDFFIEGKGSNYINLSKAMKKDEDTNYIYSVFDVYKYDYFAKIKEDDIFIRLIEREQEKLFTKIEVNEEVVDDNNKNLEIFEKNRKKLYNEFENSKNII